MAVELTPIGKAAGRQKTKLVSAVSACGIACQFRPPKRLIRFTRTIALFNPISPRPNGWRAELTGDTCPRHRSRYSCGPRVSIQHRIPCFVRVNKRKF